ncbi:MAG: ATP-binding cassette domain-containing protein [Anaerobiospirillum succiniciproducens]|uniref:ATP-binding cassette domain-containing protein n=1 Tax=Anaerobiospirillum succiniciproducens TaxID=13335 RepID=UPI0026DC1355|nr:ATP-binding cassette domain-containing protein [Anaerobiospirillum succiniciproducens]MDO4675753.1 ATP-binding cassette domain-containing protein [Anaerobiospirillum succiniciproducens]
MSALLSLKDLTKIFKKQDGSAFAAVDKLNLEIGPEHHMISLIGPDGSGKSTLLKMIAGLIAPDEGICSLNLEPKGSGALIGYMSQTLGLYEDLSVMTNLRLFATLRDIDARSLLNTSGQHTNSPQSTSNDDIEAALDLYLEDLLAKVGLIKFKDYKAGSLSGGMKQKLALTCAISAKPALLLLDEPTVGVDPISRGELWAIIEDYIRDTGSYCLFSSLYLEEADKASLTIFIKEGKLLFAGTAAQLRDDVANQCYYIDLHEDISYQKLSRYMMCHLSDLTSLKDICPRMGRIELLAENDVSVQSITQDLKTLFAKAQDKSIRAVADNFTLLKRPSVLEDAYIDLTYDRHSGSYASELLSNLRADGHDSNDDDSDGYDASGNKSSSFEGNGEVVISVDGIRKDFGSFTAVHDSNFKVYKGEIFGLLGPNGAGKTTTFRMICSLLNPSHGTILINNLELKHAKSSVRATIGYVAQKFCLYRKLTAMQNLTYFGQSYGLKGKILNERISAVSKVFMLEPFLNEISENLPFGIQRSLSMACALIHSPSILFLDEATSGADPTSRRAFWSMIASLAANGTTVIVTTHFMEEAEYCDRFLIQDQGKILILGTPDEICLQGNKRISIEEAFVKCVNERRNGGVK